MATFIKLTDHGGQIELFVNIEGVFSMHRQPGTDCTVLKGNTGAYDKVTETPAEIIKLMLITTGGYHPG